MPAAAVHGRRSVCVCVCVFMRERGRVRLFMHVCLRAASAWASRSEGRSAFLVRLCAHVMMYGAACMRLCACV